MSRSKGAATAIIDAPHGAIVATHARVLGAPANEPAIGDRRDSRLVGFRVGPSEGQRSFWERPQRGAFQAACVKRAGKGGRAVRIGVRDGPVMDRNGRPRTNAALATSRRLLERMDDLASAA
jgi:hypothetical protein